MAAATEEDEDRIGCTWPVLACHPDPAFPRTLAALELSPALALLE